MKNKIKKIHFVGIGGSGMSGIAEVMHTLGFTVTGSDTTESTSVKYLKKIGIKIFNKHTVSNIKGVNVLVVSSAISNQNIEFKTALDNEIPIIPRAEMLSELMRFKKGIAVAGTHGKTTTTSLIASILSEGNLDPTYVIGGRLNSMNMNAKLGTGELMVVEADESDASFLHLNPVNTVVTNIDKDHLDAYQGSFERLKEVYVDFIHQVPFYENIFLCIDDVNIKNIIPSISRPIVTYGLSDQAQIQAVNIKVNKRNSSFDVIDKKYKKRTFSITLNFPGEHFVQNALASIAVGLEYEVKIPAIKKALKGFQGVERRYQIYDDIRKYNKNIMIIDDYGHHPTEIKAVLDATLLAFPGKQLNLVFQPHRFSRTRDCWEDFINVLQIPDKTFLLDIYSAGEEPITNISTSTIIKKINNSKIFYIKDFKKAEKLVFTKIDDGSILIIMGAGNISQLARDFTFQNG